MFGGALRVFHVYVQIVFSPPPHAQRFYLPAKAPPRCDVLYSLMYDVFQVQMAAAFQLHDIGGFRQDPSNF